MLDSNRNCSVLEQHKVFIVKLKNESLLSNRNLYPVDKKHIYNTIHVVRVSIQQEWLEAVSYLYFGSTLHPLLLRNGVGNNHRLKHRVVDARNGWSWEDSVGTNCINFGGPCFSKSRKEFMYMYCNHHLKANFYYVLHFRNHVCDWVFIQILYTLTNSCLRVVLLNITTQNLKFKLY